MRAVVRSIVVAGVLGGLVVLVPPAPVGADRSRPPVPDIGWGSCGEDFPGAECALATVPLDYDKPRAGTTEIALAQDPRHRPGHRIGSVFVNPGGPGGSGVGLVLFGFGEFLRDNLGGRFDVVGFDPRGVGGSDPLHCFDSEDELVRVLRRPGRSVPLPRRPVPPVLRRQPRARAGVPRRRTARSARHMSTADVARDLDLLRQAVGDRKLTYLGFSYGSYLGNTYANLFPQQRAGPRHRRRARSAAVVERVADRVRPGRHARGVRGVPAALRRSRTDMRLLVAAAVPPPAGRRSPAACGSGRSSSPDGFVYTLRLPDRRRHRRDVRARDVGLVPRAPERCSTSSPTPCSATRRRQRRSRRSRAGSSRNG